MNLMPLSGKLLLGAINKDLVAKMLKDKGRELAQAMREALPLNYKFLVVLQDGEQTAFFSDSDRADAIRALKSVLAELERGS